MELIFILAGVVLVIWVLSKVFGGKKAKKEKDRYVVVQERQTVVKNHIVKVPTKKKGRK